MVLLRQHASRTDEVDPAEVVADRDQAEWLVASLRHLPKTTREICLAVGQGASREQVAKEFGLTDRAVESHLTRARRLLRGLRIAVLVPVLAAVDKVARSWSGLLNGAAVVVPTATAMVVILYPSPAPVPALPGSAISAEHTPAPTRKHPAIDAPPVPRAAAPTGSSAASPTKSTAPPGDTHPAPSSEPAKSSAPLLPQLPLKPTSLLPGLAGIPALPPLPALPSVTIGAGPVHDLVNGLVP
jgi:DNA-binding CsgD family transcriptional regulator